MMGDPQELHRALNPEHDASGCEKSCFQAPTPESQRETQDASKQIYDGSPELSDACDRAYACSSAPLSTFLGQQEVAE